uniref:Uncharacterized protein n=1 Tax=Anguilla anguilla TaxID=7936 RepID=A0A0E9W8I1_ANGAN
MGMHTLPRKEKKRLRFILISALIVILKQFELQK